MSHQATTLPGRVVCFGEIMFRLAAPDDELLLQSARLKVSAAGAEANVAVSLARLGHPVRMVSVLPDNALGEAMVEEIRRHGVDVSGMHRAPGRMGLYFLTPGAGMRPSEVLYDRAGSAFAEAAPDFIDWKREFEGADWFHLSGVTPAIGPNAAAAAIRAARAAREMGLTVSFDGNFRQKLWEVWKGDAPALLRQILEQADILFGDHRDISLILGRGFEGEGGTRRRAAADAAFEAFPQLKRMICTIRVAHSADENDLAGRMYTREDTRKTPAASLNAIVDRIGGGDAFAAGVIHGLRRGLPDQEALEFGLAAARLKHTIPGDFNLASERDIRALMAGGGADVRR